MTSLIATMLPWADSTLKHLSMTPEKLFYKNAKCRWNSCKPTNFRVLEITKYPYRMNLKVRKPSDWLLIKFLDLMFLQLHLHYICQYHQKDLKIKVTKNVQFNKLNAI